MDHGCYVKLTKLQNDENWISYLLFKKHLWQVYILLIFRESAGGEGGRIELRKFTKILAKL